MSRTTIFHSVSKLITNIPYRRVYKKITTFIKKRPLGSFFICLGLLLIVILLGNFINRPAAINYGQTPVKQVEIYALGKNPMITYQAKIEKTGVIKIMSSQAGIVQSVAVTNGQKVTSGQQIVSLENNYAGGNSAAISAQIANEQYQNMVATFPEQLDAISQQENIANINLTNFNDQQSIASQSAIATTSLTNSNQNLLNSLNQQLSDAQASNSALAVTNPISLEISELQGTQNTLSNSLNTLASQLNSVSPQVSLANAQHALTDDQLDLQEKMLYLNKNVMQLQAQLSDVTLANMTPVSPVDGVVERVYVHPGDTVTATTQLATITANTHQTTAIVNIPQQVAQSVSRDNVSYLNIGGNTYPMKPYYVSSEATDGLLYAMYYAIPPDAAMLLTDGQYISVSIPVGSSVTGSIFPYVPIDAVYQTPTTDYLLIDSNGRAVTRTVQLGQIFGDYTEITSGLLPNDKVILDRTIVAGDRVSAN